MRIYVFKTVFSDGRASLMDVVVADTEGEAYLGALEISKGIDEPHYGTDENPAVEILGALSSCPKTVIKDIRNGIKAFGVVDV